MARKPQPKSPPKPKRALLPVALTAIIAAMFLASTVAAVETQPAPLTPLQASHSVVALWAPDKHGGASGVLVAPGTILTAYHVVASGEQLTAETYDGKTFPVSTTWTDKTDDLALVHYDGDAKEPMATLACKTLQPGDKIMAIGHPMMKAMWSVTWGHVASAKEGQFDALTQKLVTLDLTILPGNSGGPIFDTNGDVVAISDAVLLAGTPFGGGSPSGISFGIPVSQICKTFPRV